MENGFRSALRCRPHRKSNDQTNIMVALMATRLQQLANAGRDTMRRSISSAQRRFLLFGFFLSIAALGCLGASNQDDHTGSISYEGVLTTGVVAIGGETTGVTLKTEKDGVFELDFGTNKDLSAAAEKLNGKKVRVTGDYKPRPGVEV